MGHGHREDHRRRREARCCTPTAPTIRADGHDLSFITVRIADKDGLTVPRTHNLVRFAD